jgi:hypothetical protein
MTGHAKLIAFIGFYKIYDLTILQGNLLTANNAFHRGFLAIFRILGRENGTD